MIRGALALVALFTAATVGAQMVPPIVPTDPRLQSLDYRSGEVVRVEAAPGYLVTIELAPDERVQTVAVGDSASWQVSTNRRGDHLFVKPVQAGPPTNMTVVTDVRTYAFDLTALPGPSPAMAYTMRFRYPRVTSPLPSAVAGMEGRYKLSGARTLRPNAISDDGAKTYIRWAPDVALPAVFAVDAQNRETLANGNMREDFYVIDSISPRLVFRIDKQVARADRLRMKARK